MNKFLICVLIGSTFVVNTVSEGAATALQCYQCSPVTQECEDNEADIVKCAAVSTARCSRQVRKDSSDKSKALRKCILVDTAGNCPNGNECFNCDQNLCNANPIVTSTTSSPNSSPLTATCLWSAVVAAIFAVIYL